MFVGHMAVALGAKARAPRSSLGVFVAAAFAQDLLWPVFLLLGIERVRIDPGNTKFTPLAFDSYPWSHSLVMAVVWGVVGSVLVRIRRGNRGTQVLVLLLVISHWVLDFVSHRADMPLWPGKLSLAWTRSLELCCRNTGCRRSDVRYSAYGLPSEHDGGRPHRIRWLLAAHRVFDPDVGEPALVFPSTQSADPRMVRPGDLVVPAVDRVGGPSPSREGGVIKQLETQETTA